MRESRRVDLGQTSARVFLRASNLLDKAHVGSVIVNETDGRCCEPAPGRAWLAGLDLTF